MTRKFPPSVGGMEKYAAELSTALSQKTDIKLIKWGSSTIWLPIILPYFFVRGLWTLATQKIDVIHMQDGLLSPIGAVFKMITNKPLCVVIHGLDVTYRNRLYQAVVVWALKRADKIICISQAAKTEVDNRQIDPTKSLVIPLGINDDIFSADHQAARHYLEKELILDKDAKILLSVGRLVKRKGVDWFISNVMPKLVGLNDKVIFLISGDGENRDSIQQAVVKNKLQANVRLLGRTSQAMRQNLYNGADIFVMPNVQVKDDMEGFGLVLLEASLCELPVVAADIEGIKDAITNNKNGLLVPTQDVESQLQSITKFINDSTYAKQFGQQSRAFTLAHYNWPAIALSFIRVYDGLIPKGK